MINLGTIGTNWITERMLEAATTIGAYRLQAVYSRHSATAAQFAHDHAGQRSYTNLTDFFSTMSRSIRFILLHLIVSTFSRFCKRCGITKM